MKVKFEEEVERWIEQGWLVPCRDKPMCVQDLGEGVIPLMAVVQLTKQKDFRGLNKFVECHLGKMLQCVVRQSGSGGMHLPEPLKLVDLKSAYLQL